MKKFRNVVNAISLVILFISCSDSDIHSVESVTITVSDMAVALPFYKDILHFEIKSDNTFKDNDYSALVGIESSNVRIAKLQLGDELIELIDYLEPEGKSYPEDSKSNDLWFQHIAIITNNMDSAYTWLNLNNVRNISNSPQLLPDWNKNAGGIKAFYFQDPDGHPLEILEFPPNKGNVKWHVKSNNIFLGIDHTAIAISDSKESLKFYRETLGMRIIGESENYGIEQERLNNVDGAHLKITGLGTDSGFGIEFLNYLNPQNGRHYPTDVKANDLIHWQIKLVTNNIQSLFSKLYKNGYKTYNNSVINFNESEFNFKSGFIVLDPDGHRLLIVSK